MIEGWTISDITRWESFFERQEDGHWIWNGLTVDEGKFPVFSLPVRGMRSARAVAWEIYKNEPVGKARIHRTCEEGLCINPDHSMKRAFKSRKVNGWVKASRRKAANNKISQTMKDKKQGKCTRGHDYTPENTHTVKRTNPQGIVRTTRSCKTCAREREARRRETYVRPPKKVVPWNESARKYLDSI